jgi:hypothetical protein
VSSRVRLMFQDYNNGVAHMGQQAYKILQGLYNNWEKAQTKTQKEKRTIWVRTTASFAADLPFMCNYWDTIPAGRNVRWEGPSFYREDMETVERPAQGPEPLAKGPKWLMALEMWERLSPSHNGRYRLFVSRDNRKQSWRHSLCNPFVQGWGFKPRVAKPNKLKKNIPAPTFGRSFAEEYLERTMAHTVKTPPKPKPRVGIWS